MSVKARPTNARSAAAPCVAAASPWSRPTPDRRTSSAARRLRCRPAALAESLSAGESVWIAGIRRLNMRFTNDGEDYPSPHVWPGVGPGRRYEIAQGQPEIAPAKEASGPQDASAFERQVGGTHYSDMAIQPALYVYLNNIGAREADAIGYLSRWRQKGGLEDLRKAIHNIELLIELETKYGSRKACRVEPEESNGV